jgi:hypothetical protein
MDLSNDAVTKSSSSLSMKTVHTLPPGFSDNLSRMRPNCIRIYMEMNDSESGMPIAPPFAVTSVMRIGSFVMVLFLVIPLVRDCCLPVTHSLPCHQQSKRTDDNACDALLQAVNETRSAPVCERAVQQAAFIAGAGPSQVPATAHRLGHELRFTHTSSTDIYLRTGVLLI